jgi:hypothetical protein
MILKTNRKGNILQLWVVAIGNTPFSLLAVDADAPYTRYIQYKTNLIAGENYLEFPLPISPERLKIYGESPLQVVMKEAKFENPVIKRKIEVADPELIPYVVEIADFAQEASYAPLGYHSAANDLFHIHYVPYITDYDTGATLRTPARTVINSGNMEVSKQMFLPLTVGLRVFILLHERAHHQFEFAGGDLNSEQFADDFAKKIFLALGFGAFEFQNLLGQALSYNEQNRQRVEALQN